MCYVHVVIPGAQDKRTRVKRTSVELNHHRPPPQSYEEAALYQHPDIEQHFDALVDGLVSCGIESDSDEILDLFLTKLREAEVRLQALGAHARMRMVEWDNPQEAAQEPQQEQEENEAQRQQQEQRQEQRQRQEQENGETVHA